MTKYHPRAQEVLAAREEQRIEMRTVSLGAFAGGCSTLLLLTLVGAPFLCGQSAATAASENPARLLARAHAIALSGKAEDARELYLEARRLFEQSGDLAGQATVDVHLSDLALQRGRVSEAAQHRKNAYRLFQQAEKGFSQALTLRELGMLTACLEDFSKAAEMLDHAAPMFHHLGSPIEAYSTRAILLAVLTCDPESDLGCIIGHARSLLSADDPKPAPDVLTFAYQGLGYAQQYLGDYETALGCYEEALECLKDAHLPQGLHKNLQEVLESNRASVLVYLERPEEAASVFDGLAKARLERGEKELAVLNFGSASVAWRYAEDLDRAESCLQAAEHATSRYRLPSRVKAMLELNRGRIYYERGRLSGACEQYQRALAHLPKTSQDCWRFHYFYALALDRVGREMDADQQLKTAVRRCEENRGRASEFRQRAAYYESKGDVFAALVSILMRKGDTEEAFEVVERHKARCFLDLLLLSSAAPRQVVPGGLVSSPRLMEFMTEIAKVSGDDRTRGFGVALEKHSTRTEQVSRETLAEEATRPQDPLPAARQARTLEAIQSALRADECILEYYLCREVGHGFLIRPQDLQSWTFRRGREEIGSLVREWRHEVETDRSEQPGEHLTASESALSEALISPVWDTVVDGSVKTVYVVGDGPLHYVPLGALRNGERDRLLYHVAVAHVPSASSFVALCEGETSNSLNSVLVVANPENDLPRLSFALQEAGALQQHFPDRLLLTGKQAHKKAVLEALPKCDVVAFGVHGKMNDSAPTQSCLILSGKAESPDSQLTVSEIANMRLRARLAILSACESGLAGGRTRQFPKGDDIEGIARAFMLAGVPTVLGTLWQVPDRASALLIEDFVENVKVDQLPPAEALRQAQIGVLDSSAEKTSSPYYWAGFGVYGLSRR